MMPTANPHLPGSPQAPALKPVQDSGPSALICSINSSSTAIPRVCHSQEEVPGLTEFRFLANAEKLQAITTGVFMPMGRRVASPPRLPSPSSPSRPSTIPSWETTYANLPWGNTHEREGEQRLRPYYTVTCVSQPESVWCLGGPPLCQAVP